jgi:hypothetical protein
MVIIQLKKKQKKKNYIDPSIWIVRTKGWVLSHNSSSTKQKMMMGKLM